MTSAFAPRVRTSLIVTIIALFVVVASAAAASVTPSNYSASADPGETLGPITKTVTTPEIPPNPDIVFAIDKTGSMTPAITDVQTGLGNIMSTVTAAQPTAQFAVSTYEDAGDPPPVFDVLQGLTANQTDVQNAVNSITVGGGGDAPEDWINALWEIANGAVTFRPDSTRFVVLLGDASSHDPSLGHTLADAIAALAALDIHVIAIDVGPTPGADGLDAAGQATAVATATGGQYLLGEPEDASALILAGLENQPVTVTHTVSSCDPDLSVSLTPASITVTSGEDAVFSETIEVSAGAPEGATLNCTVEFLINDMPADLVQTIEITVNDVTAPETTCTPTVNPAGKTVPAAGDNPKSGQNPDGFYLLTAIDNLDPDATVTVTDSGSGTVFGPFPSGTRIKYVQSPDEGPSIEPGPGVIDWKIVGTGDALVTGTDASGNTATATCLVPAPPK